MVRGFTFSEVLITEIVLSDYLINTHLKQSSLILLV